MLNYFEMADKLETAAAGLGVAKDLLSITMEDVFTHSNNLIPYQKMFESVLVAAFDKVIEQEKVMCDIAEILMDIHKETKGE